MPGAVVFIFFLAIRLLYAYQRGSAGGATRPVIHLRTFLWLLVAAFWLLTMFLAFGGVLVTLTDAFRGRANLGWLARVLVFFAATQAGGLLFLFPWRPFVFLARRGKYKLLYYLAHFLLAFPGTVEPYAGASFVAYLALAYRGDVTREELDWVGRRLAKEKRALGLFGAAFALSHALEGKLAADRGCREEAEELRERARVLFGTITYLSPAACPRNVRKFAHEYLTLDAARRAEWGAVEATPPADLTGVTVAIRKWVRENLSKQKEPESRMARQAAKMPISLALTARRHIELDASPDASFERMSRAYAALANGERQSPRETLHSIHAFDRFFDPRSPDCRLPPEVRADDETFAVFADSIADAVTSATRSRGVPIFCLPIQGAISARVHQRLETLLTSELRAALRAGRERAERHLRGTIQEEWLEVSRIRGLYRRLEYTLGTPAAGAFAQQMFYEYGKLGVLLSETIPRRRPLAHAVFACLRREATRFQAPEALARETRNMKVTARID